jgi:hypothetical protein
VGEGLFGWHAKIGVVAACSDYDTTLVWLSGKERRAGVAALCDALARVEEQAALSFAGSNRVTFKAVLNE